MFIMKPMNTIKFAQDIDEPKLRLLNTSFHFRAIFVSERLFKLIISIITDCFLAIIFFNIKIFITSLFILGNSSFKNKVSQTALCLSHHRLCFGKADLGKEVIYAINQILLMKKTMNIKLYNSLNAKDGLFS